MKNRFNLSIVKVFILLVAVIAMILSIPSSIIPTNINNDVDVLDNQTNNNGDYANDIINNSNNKEEILTNNALLDDSFIDDLFGDDLNKDYQTNNSGISEETNEELGFGDSQGTGEGSESNGSHGTGETGSNNYQDNLLTDDKLNFVNGDLTDSTETTQLKYFDVTMFKYNTNAYNAATKNSELVPLKDVDLYKGIYFRKGDNLPNENKKYGYYIPTFESGNAVVEDGRYLIVNIRSNQFISGNETSINGKLSMLEANIWTIKQVNGGYTIQDEAGKYLNINGQDIGNVKLSADAMTLSLKEYSHNNRGIQISKDGNYLCQYDNAETNSYGAHNSNNDDGNGMYLIKVDYVKPTFSDSKANITDGYYYIVNDRSREYLKGSSENIKGVTSLSEATVWKITADGVSYKVQTLDGQYLNIGTEGSSITGVKVSGDAQDINIKKFTPGTSNDTADYPNIAITFDNGSKYLNDYQGTGNLLYGNENTAGDGGNSMYLIPVKVNESIDKIVPTFDTNNVATDISGEYYILNKRSNHYLQGTFTSINETESFDDATLWIFTKNDDGTYTIKDQNNNYLNTGTVEGENGCKVSDIKQHFDITKYVGDGNDASTIQIGKTEGTTTWWLSDYNGTWSNQFGNWHEENDTGHAMYLGTRNISVSLDLDFGTKEVGYAPWNVWTGTLNSNTRGYVFNSLVKNTLDANGNIQFNYPESGLFTLTDDDTKDVYERVGFPFLYSNGLYSFDALADSARFVNGAKDDEKLTWNDATQAYRDNWETEYSAGFLPFNNDGIGNLITDPNYHFGMKAELSFYMTPDGKSIVDGKDIEFNFAGDDDVWVFIDGKLVLDMGGIHDSVDGRINFAQNSSYIKATSNDQTSGYYYVNNGRVYDENGRPFNTQIANAGQTTLQSKPLFNIVDENNNVVTEGIMNETLASFANDQIHTLTVYYLERGAAASNFELSFNLPLNDTVNVVKRVEGSKDKDGKVYELTKTEREMVNNLDYKFTIYKDEKPLNNHPYKVLNAETLELIQTGMTDANGMFMMKTGQIVSFDEDIGNASTFKVVEEQMQGFVDPDNYVYYSGAGTISPVNTDANGNVRKYTGWESQNYTVHGLSYSMDYMAFVYENYLEAYMPNPSIYPNDDQYVLDFGLEVDLQNVLTNDIYKGDTVEITSVVCEEKNSTSQGVYGTFTWDKDGNVTYKLNKQLTKPEVLKYTVKVTSKITNESKVETANIYIMPATSIYYEENFTGLVTYKVANGTDVPVPPWRQEGTSLNHKQESGVVGDPTDSCYGSDQAYLEDNGDSNGTSMYVNTSNGPAQFKYTFTGTGTSFFARTSNMTGTMRVRIYKGTEKIYELMRDTSYKTDNNDTTLFNIPVFTYHVPGTNPYGTYTVEVTLARSTITTDNGNAVVVSQPEFYLDGITVFNPLDESYKTDDDGLSLSLVERTKSAYASDDEANNTVKTLRDKIITDHITNDNQNWNGDKFVIFTDSDGEILLGGDDKGNPDEANIYVSNGPKEEVYMVDGQKIQFALKGFDVNQHTVYLGIKAPMGGAKVLINGNELSINNAKECYYDITRFVTLVKDEHGEYIPVFVIEADKSNEEGASSLGLISVTNIRVTGNVEFTIAPDVNI